MDGKPRERAALLAFFLPLTVQTCDDLAAGDETVAACLADVLGEFARSDVLSRVRALAGRRLTSVVEMLSLEHVLPDEEGERAFRRYLGDYTLFMSGLFRPFVERAGYLGWYLSEGARAYSPVAKAAGRTRRDRMLYEELSVRFEHYSGALDYLRKVRFPSRAAIRLAPSCTRSQALPVARRETRARGTTGTSEKATAAKTSASSGNACPNVVGDCDQR
jgi:hypothetical protein